MGNENVGPVSEREALGARVAALRGDRGWSQGELGRRLQSVGMADAYQMKISRIEKAERDISVLEALDIAEVFGITIDELVGRVDIHTDAQAGIRDAIAVLQAELDRRAQ